MTDKPLPYSSMCSICGMFEEYENEPEPTTLSTDPAGNGDLQFVFYSCNTCDELLNRVYDAHGGVSPKIISDLRVAVLRHIATQDCEEHANCGDAVMEYLLPRLSRKLTIAVAPDGDAWLATCEETGDVGRGATPGSASSAAIGLVAERLGLVGDDGELVPEKMANYEISIQRVTN